MPAPIKSRLGLYLIFFLLTFCARGYEAPTIAAPRPFHYNTDTFAFANETVWNYANGSVQKDAPAKKRDYTRRCFVMTRAAVQFWKFARFEPKLAPLSPEQLADRIRDITGRSVWLPPLPRDQRIVLTGYSDLRSLSAASPTIFQANIGLGWPVYFRAGNAPIASPIYRETEARLNDEIFRDLKLNYPTIVWLFNFPSLNINHVVVVMSGQKVGLHYRYQVYDPNYEHAARTLSYDIKSRTFFYEPTFYFKGGSVQARAVYRGVLQ